MFITVFPYNITFFLNEPGRRAADYIKKKEQYSDWAQPTKKKDIPAGWIGTSTRPHNSTQALLYKTTTPRDDGSKTEALPQHPPTTHTPVVVENLKRDHATVEVEGDRQHHTKKATAMQDPTPQCRCNITLHPTG